MNSALELERLSTGYGSLTVSRDITLALRPGETVGILGVNGAGKSTLLKTICGALPEQGGSVKCAGIDVSGWASYRRTRAGLALVPEGRQILGSLSVQDNLELTRAALRKDSADTFGARLDEVFDIFPRLKERALNPSISLSGGEQQMLAISRALLTAPTVMMLDEPTQGLAPVVVQLLRNVLSSFKGRFAMLVVEQNRAFLEVIADRILEMRSGRLHEL